MTGWRLGYTLAPEWITKQMAKVHQFGIMCAPTTSQYAAIEALKNGDGDIEYMKGEYEGRRRLIVTELERIGIDTFMPEGAFYVFPSIAPYRIPSGEFCRRMIREAGLAVTPGFCFGSDQHIRLTYCYGDEALKEGLDRLAAFLQTL